MADLRDALELVHGARRAFRSLDVTVRHWYDATAAYRAHERLMGKGRRASVIGSRDDGESEVAARLWIELPSRLRQEQVLVSAHPGASGWRAEPSVLVVDGDNWWSHGSQFGTLADTGLPNSGSFTFTGREQLIDPRWLMGMELTVVGTAEVAGRNGIRLRATPSPENG
ncbi:MAG: hypothetical protein M3144_05065 [Actinomycetota bacterium]|nr:hypothetical protein [Actinomycetota bacterium]